MTETTGRGAAFVHGSATVEAGAVIGRGTRIWHHAHVRDGAVIGDRCTLGKNVFVDKGVSIGNDVKVQNNVSVYVGVHIEDEVLVGPSAVFTNDRFPRATAADWQVSPTRVRRGASIGANATVVAGNDIGEWALVAAGAVVTRTVLPHEVVAGNPARGKGWICKCTATRVGANDHSLCCEKCGTYLPRLGDQGAGGH